MTTTLERPVAVRAAGSGGSAGRRAVRRWAWRLFRREWRQQLLVLAMITVAVGGTVLGATVATNAPAQTAGTFGTAPALVNLPTPDPHLARDLAAIGRVGGPTDVIENQTLPIPGSIDTYSLRSQDPHGPYGGPLLSLLSGRYPSGPGEVAMTPDVLSALHLRVGDQWHHDGTARTVVGTVQNPPSLLDQFALVVPGQVTDPGSVTVLFGGSPHAVSALGFHVQLPTGNTSALNPKTLSLALATVGMLLIGLVAVAGFTVLAQRRLRAIGMLGALGATDRHVRQVVRTNGMVTGVVGALCGLVLGLVGWVLYRPRLETTSHHVIGLLAIPWTVVGIAVVLALVTTFLAAGRPAKSVARVPIVAALSGHPPAPKAVHRSAVPGAVAVVAAFLLLGYAGASNGNGGGAPALVFGFVALIVAIVLLAPLALGPVGRLARRTPVSVRIALRDLARYRARSGSSLAAISLGVLVAMVICLVASVRYGDILDYAGPNLASNQMVVYSSSYGGNGPGAPPSGPAPSLSRQAAVAQRIARSLGATGDVALESTDANLQTTSANGQFNGVLYVATPQLLAAYGIPASTARGADILSMRPGLSTTGGLELTWQQAPGKGGPPPPGPGNQNPCPPDACKADPVIREVPQLPAGTSAPNTLITEGAVAAHHLGGSVSVTGWLVEAPNALSAAQISTAEAAAGQAGMSVETKNDEPTSAEVLNWATAAGVLLALAVLAMTVGLIRSETADELRTLAATGASSRTRRTITAATAGALAVLGALVGTAGAYVATTAFFSGAKNHNAGLLNDLARVPVPQLLVILVGLPLLAVVGGFVFAGREPSQLGQQPLT